MIAVQAHGAIEELVQIRIQSSSIKRRKLRHKDLSQNQCTFRINNKIFKLISTQFELWLKNKILFDYQTLNMLSFSVQKIIYEMLDNTDLKHTLMQHNDDLRNWQTRFKSVLVFFWVSFHSFLNMEKCKQ